MNIQRMANGIEIFLKSACELTPEQSGKLLQHHWQQYQAHNQAFQSLKMRGDHAGADRALKTADRHFSQYQRLSRSHQVRPPLPSPRPSHVNTAIRNHATKDPE